MGALFSTSSLLFCSVILFLFSLSLGLGRLFSKEKHMHTSLPWRKNIFRYNDVIITWHHSFSCSLHEREKQRKNWQQHQQQNIKNDLKTGNTRNVLLYSHTLFECNMSLFVFSTIHSSHKSTRLVSWYFRRLNGTRRTSTFDPETSVHVYYADWWMKKFFSIW